MNRTELILALSLLGLKEDASSKVTNDNGYISYVGGSFTIDINNYESTHAFIFLPHDMINTLDGKYLSKDDGNDEFTFEQILSFVSIMADKENEV